MSTTQTRNGIDLLVAQHQQVKALLEVIAIGGASEPRQAAFDELRHLLAIHETAEELVLRPVTRTAIPNGNEIVDARFAEENEAKKVLAELEKLGVDDPTFDELFARFKTSVLAHAEAEEKQEFAPVRAQQEHGDIADLGLAIEKAEETAPTHPHPSAKTTTANVVLGPFASLLDHARDAIKEVTSK
jgi:hemerythrin superfamily protein